MMTKELEREARNEQRLNSSFEKWLSQPMTRMGISMIPAGDRDDALRFLLRSAFDAGADTGAGNVAGEMASAILESMMKKDKDARN
jgi:hypothetical protein